MLGCLRPADATSTATFLPSADAQAAPIPNSETQPPAGGSCVGNQDHDHASSPQADRSSGLAMCQEAELDRRRGVSCRSVLAVEAHEDAARVGFPYVANPLQIDWIWASLRNESGRNLGPRPRGLWAAVPPQAIGIDVGHHCRTGGDQLLTTRLPAKTLGCAPVDLAIGAEY